MRLVLFDLDGTLISSYMDTPDKDINHWELLPGRRERLAELSKAGVQVGVITNQGAVAWRYVMEMDIINKIGAVANALGYEAATIFSGPPDLPLSVGFGRGLDVYVCWGDPRSKDTRYNNAAICARRKPSGAMIREAMAEASVSAAETLYVGDRPEDEAAAADAGVAFRWAAEYFGD